MEWYLIVVLICISIITNDIEHLFLYLMSICISLMKSIQIISIVRKNTYIGKSERKRFGARIISRKLTFDWRN